MAIKHYKMSGFFSQVGTPIADQIALYDNRFVTATLTKETEDREVRGVIDGNDLLQVTDAYQTSESYTFETETESIDSGTLALMFGEAWAQTTSWDKPKKTKRASVPAVTPFTIVDAEILNTFTAADVQVTIAENGAWGRVRPLEVITTGTPTVDQVLLTASTGTLTLDEDNARAPIKYAIKSTKANIWTLGVEANPKKLDEMMFVGTVSTTRREEIIVVVESMGPSGGWELPVGEETSINLTWRPTAKGSNRSAVQFGRIAA